MHRQSPHSLRNRTRGYLVAAEFVLKIADQWRRGLPTQLARKVLRKRGIHPWSLLPHVDDEELNSLRRALRLPPWVERACGVMDPSSGEVGFAFIDVQGVRRLPAGIVAPSVELENLPHLEHSPRRMWTQSLTVRDTPRLRHLQAGPVPMEVLILERCSSLKRVPPGMVIPHVLEIRDCSVLRQLPRLGKGRYRRTMVRLDRLPKLRNLGVGSQIADLWLWRCTALEHLHQVIVGHCLIIHGCLDLRTLPPVNRLTTLEVTDCPDLSRIQTSGDWPEGRFEPWSSPCCWSPPEQRPKVAGAESPRLLPDEPDGLAWPWPPPGMVAPWPDLPVFRTLTSLRVGVLDQLRLLAGLARDLPGSIRHWLASQADPPAAVRLAGDWLKHMKSCERPLALQVLAQVEALGLGAVSVAHQLEQRQLDELDLVFEADWIRTFQGPESRRRSPREHSERLQGPLVLDSVWPEWIQNTDLHIVEGPLWVAGDLIIRDCPYLETLPDRLVVEGDLVISDCPGLRELPRWLEVRGKLEVSQIPALVPKQSRDRDPNSGVK